MEPSLKMPLAKTTRRTATPRRPSRWLSRLAVHLFLVLFSVFAVFPGVLTILASFKSLFDFYSGPLQMPQQWLWQNYVSAWNDAGILQAAINSLAVVAVSVPLVLVCSCCAAYGISQYRWRGSDLIYYTFLSGLIFPIQLTILPVVVLNRNLGLINTYAGLILPYIGFGMPFAVFLLTGFLKTLPSELRDAGLIDGANEFQVFWYIIIPLMRPGLATVAILSTVGIWNDFFFPLIVSPKIPMLQVGVYNLLGVYSTEWGHIFAGVVISAVPLIVAYLAMTKQFIAGLSAGSVKG